MKSLSTLSGLTMAPSNQSKRKFGLPDISPSSRNTCARAVVGSNAARTSVADVRRPILTRNEVCVWKLATGGKLHRPWASGHSLHGCGHGGSCCRATCTPESFQRWARREPFSVSTIEPGRSRVAGTQAQSCGGHQPQGSPLELRLPNCNLPHPPSSGCRCSGMPSGCRWWGPVQKSHQ